ncbi:MAG: S41 family peptidase [Flavobacteriales bacterium]|jgi:C-terminal processing protease CtpA/Prc|nr:S41 family peptidase [Flavobacteriales bacterium]
MKKIHLIFPLILLFSFQNQQDLNEIPIKDLKADLDFLDHFIEKNSSYSGLNGFNYKEEFNFFLKSNKPKTKEEFGIFLTKVIGKIGDRHANIRGFKLSNDLFFPIAFAPLQKKIIVLNYDNKKEQYKLFNQSFPVLKTVDNILIDDLLKKLIPEELSAPKEAYFTRATRALRDIDKIYSFLGKQLPQQIKVTLSNFENSKDTTILLRPVKKTERINKWDEEFYRDFFHLDKEHFNQEKIIQQLFNLKDSIAYFRIPKMVGKNTAPKLFMFFNEFMNNIQKESKALIIDVRSNGGGVRDLIYEIAGYVIHPDSVYIVNAVRQRGKTPLHQDLKENLHSRFLFSIDELEPREKIAVKKFNIGFRPMFDLDDKKFSQFHYALFNGKKLSKNKFYYNKPVYILANERSFSAASVLVALFKGLPNIKIVGINTDGSSGNSVRFELPHTKLRGKISTMVSFQKNGQLFDGYGTQPDIRIDRDLNQILWKSDYQLQKLIEMIKS